MSENTTCSKKLFQTFFFPQFSLEGDISNAAVGFLYLTVPLRSER